MSLHPCGSVDTVSRDRFGLLSSTAFVRHCQCSRESDFDEPTNHACFAVREGKDAGCSRLRSLARLGSDSSRGVAPINAPLFANLSLVLWNECTVGLCQKPQLSTTCLECCCPCPCPCPCPYPCGTEMPLQLLKHEKSLFECRMLVGISTSTFLLSLPSSITQHQHITLTPPLTRP